MALFRCPPLLGLILRDYGDVLYRTGFPLGSYRQLLAHAQKIFPLIRPHMGVAWKMVLRWEELQPISHRTPIPEALFKALVGLSHLLGEVDCCYDGDLLLRSRPGEVLRATRDKLLTPNDALDPFPRWLYLRITAPKSRRRAALIQHVKLDDTTAMEYVVAVWENLPGRAPLYPGSPSAYRRRWDRLLQMLAVPATAGITPAIRLRTARYAAAGGSENAAP